MRKNMLWVSGCLHVCIFLCLCAENVYLLYMSVCLHDCAPVLGMCVVHMGM